jgi:hypothetical protein
VERLCCQAVPRKTTFAKTSIPFTTSWTKLPSKSANKAGNVTAPNARPINRMETVLTLHFPLKTGYLISDRNRADLDWTSETLTWRYRNKLTLERTVAIRSYHLIPYLAAEPYYEEKYHKRSPTDLYAGCLFPVGGHVQFNAYYEHENNTGKRPNQQTNQIGLALYLFFSLEAKK